MENLQVHKGERPAIADFYNNNLLQRFCKFRGKPGVKQQENLYIVRFKLTFF